MMIGALVGKLRKRTGAGVLAGALGLLLALALIVGLMVPALAQPPTPGEGFSGDVLVGGTPAPEFTPVRAEIVDVGSWATEVDDVGQYAIYVPYDDPETVEQDGGLNGDTVDFYVCGVYATSDTFGSGQATILDLSVETCGPPRTLTMAKVGQGTVTPPSGVYPEGAMAITATPDLGWVFDGWTTADMAEIAAPASQATTLTLDKDKTVTATFTEFVGPTHTLTMQVTGNGTTTPPVGVYVYPEDTVVDITAFPAAGWQFDGWTGPVDAPTNPTTVTMDADKTVTATFTQITHTLTMAKVGQGTVTPPSDDYPEGDMAITATQDPGWVFAGWTTDDMTEIANPSLEVTTLTLDKDKTVTATFTEIPSYTLTMQVVGNGTTTPAVGDHVYAADTEVDITAFPAAGWQFLTWTGDVDGLSTDNPNTVTMDADKTVTANFAEEVFAWIDIGAGWRTFSTPIALAPDFNTWGELVALGGLDVEVAYYFDGSSQNWGLVLGDYPVVPCDAIYVKMALAGTVPIVPNPDYTGPPTKELYPEWNLVGLAALDDMGVVEALISVYYVPGELLPWGYSQVVSPAINAPPAINDWVYTRDGVDPPLVVIGRGIWVFMINGGTLGGFTSTPLP